MKNLLFTIFFLTVINTLLIGQNKMIVEQPYSGNIMYGKSARQLDSISELPSVIQYNLNGYFDRILGTLHSDTKFSHGQVVNLNEYFYKDSATFGYGWIVPTYDLHFILQDTSIGLKCYYIQIRMDKYGQIIECNWPRENYSDKSKFISRTEIEQFALRQAEMKLIDTTNYEVDLKYNKSFDILCWVFKFPESNIQNPRKFKAIEIDWNRKKIVDEYEIRKSAVH